MAKGNGKGDRQLTIKSTCANVFSMSDEIQSAPATVVAEVVQSSPEDACSNPSCPTCTMVGNTLLAFESAVLLLTQELGLDKKNLAKLDLAVGVATDLGSAFSRLADRADLSKVAVPAAKQRFVAAATLMNQNYEAIRHLQLLAGISRVN